MPPMTQTGSKELGEAIRTRREKLGLTIDQAANRAHIGPKTWSRYESGESIRRDKVRGVCAALGWRTLEEGLAAAAHEEDQALFLKSIDESNEYWSPFLASTYGHKAAVEFCVGSEILCDELGLDLEELASLPKDTHLGEIPFSLTLCYLPEQFVPRYNYEFVYRLRARLEQLKLMLRYSDRFEVHMVADELLLRMIADEASPLMKYWKEQPDDELAEEWVFDVCEDDDFGMYLGDSSSYVEEGHIYHFDRWFENAFNSGR